MLNSFRVWARTPLVATTQGTQRLDGRKLKCERQLPDILILRVAAKDELSRQSDLEMCTITPIVRTPLIKQHVAIRIDWAIFSTLLEIKVEHQSEAIRHKQSLEFDSIEYQKRIELFF